MPNYFGLYGMMPVMRLAGNGRLLTTFFLPVFLGVKMIGQHRCRDK